MLVGDLNKLNSTLNAPPGTEHRLAPEQRLLQQLVLDSIAECLSYKEKGVIPNTSAEDAEQIYRENIGFLRKIDEHYLSYAGFKKKDEILDVIASIPE
ncbi:MAG: hypothetical protein GXP46_01395 [Deferribacteres bacterium]|nr:hypothetical protein [Deferribacteres bacterium]